MILQKIRKSYKKKVATYLEDKMHLYILRFSRAFMCSKSHLDLWNFKMDEKVYKDLIMIYYW